ncbi:hypothetical protein V6N11_036145 [Hibiscus sabdariffa]|uniref:Uncharacterized protein n=1 Tax=Hibiscus sabdariffa TaxID=183260 RepID=A0ABR2R9L4_9ROSI
MGRTRHACGSGGDKANSPGSLGEFDANSPGDPGELALSPPLPHACLNKLKLAILLPSRRPSTRSFEQKRSRLQRKHYAYACAKFPPKAELN